MIFRQSGQLPSPEPDVTSGVALLFRRRGGDLPVRPDRQCGTVDVVEAQCCRSSREGLP